MRDIKVGLGLIVFCCLGLIASLGISSPIVVDPIGPVAYPRALLVLIALLSTGIIIGGFRNRHAEDEVGDDADAPSRYGRWRVVGIVLLGFAYVAVVGTLGHLISTALLIAGTLLIMGVNDTFKVLLVSVLGSVGLWLVFDLLLRTPLPDGIVG